MSTWPVVSSRLVVTVDAAEVAESLAEFMLVVNWRCGEDTLAVERPYSSPGGKKASWGTGRLISVLLAAIPRLTNRRMDDNHQSLLSVDTVH